MKRLTSSILLGLLLLTNPSLSQWSRIELENGQEVCVRETGERIETGYRSASWASARCESFNLFEAWLKTAEGRVLLGSAAAPVQPAPARPGLPTPPASGSWLAIDFGDSTSAAVNEVSATEIECTGDGSGDGNPGTTDTVNGGFCYQRVNSGDVQLIANFTTFMNDVEQFTYAGICVWEKHPTLDQPDDDGAFGCIEIPPPTGGIGGTPELASKWRNDTSGTVSAVFSETVAEPEGMAISFDVSTGIFTACSTSDASPGEGSTWTVRTSTPPTLQITAPYYVGFLMASHDTMTSDTANFTSVALTTSITICGGGGGDPPPLSGLPDGPNFGCVIIGGDQQYTTTAQRQRIAENCKIAILGGNRDENGSLYSSAGITRDAALADIKTRGVAAGISAPAIGQYENFNEVRAIRQSNGTADVSDCTIANGTWSPYYCSLINTLNAWLYNNGTSGTIVAGPFDNCTSPLPSSCYGLVNMTANSPDDGNGNGPYEIAANLAYDRNVTDVANYEAPLCDATCQTYNRTDEINLFLIDNFFWEWDTSGGSGDCDRNGSTDGNTTACKQALLAGQYTYFTELVSLGFTGYYGGNDSRFPAGIRTGALTSIAPLSDIGHVGFIETAGGTWPGCTFCDLNIFDTDQMLGYYITYSDWHLDPKFIFLNINLPETETSSFASADFAFARYGMAMAAGLGFVPYIEKGNGHSAGCPVSSCWAYVEADFDDILRFDEFYGGTAVNNPEVCGQVTSGRIVPGSTYQNGVYLIETTGCYWVLVPNTVGATSITLSEDVTRVAGVSGQSDTGVNTGASHAASSSISLGAGPNGLLLIKDTP